MTLDQLLKQQGTGAVSENKPVVITGATDGALTAYPRSVTSWDGHTLFVGRLGGRKQLFLHGRTDLTGPLAKLQGSDVPVGSQGKLRACPLSHENAAVVKFVLPFTRPIIVGLKNSFGFGDRLGLANPGHLRALGKSPFVAVLAQQSIRELTRTRRKPEDVMNAAVWAVLQEGYTAGFGADADHLKTTADVDLMVGAGFTMFTIDPSEHVVNEADSLAEAELARRAAGLPWERLSDSLDGVLRRYEGKTLLSAQGFAVKPARLDILRALVKYGSALAHIRMMAEYLGMTYPQHPREIEVSVDETDSVTAPFEHFFIAAELHRLRVEIISLAPRFVGDFEKGIDYKGSIERFTEEYLRHVAIADHFGSYKISFHSGSDKFRVYEAVGKTGRGRVHVKTAGTSYLEALRVLALKDPGLFREILDFARKEFDEEKKSYHVSAKTEHVRAGKSYEEKELPALFESNDARQVLHVTFGKVLTTQKADGSYLFRDRLLNALDRGEEQYYEFLIRHFRRHLAPLTLG